MDSLDKVHYPLKSLRLTATLSDWVHDGRGGVEGKLTRMLGAPAVLAGGTKLPITCKRAAATSTRPRKPSTLKEAGLPVDVYPRPPSFNGGGGKTMGLRTAHHKF